VALAATRNSALPRRLVQSFQHGAARRVTATPHLKPTELENCQGREDVKLASFAEATWFRVPQTRGRLPTSIGAAVPELRCSAVQ
jgi:hypothetical protein